MKIRAHIGAAILLAGAISGSTAAGAAGSFDLCVEPVVPACANAAATFASREAKETCAAQMQAFLAATGRWRQCTYRRLEAVIRDVNSINDRFKCLADPEKRDDARCKGVKPPR